jgi:hypothetical protein
MLSEAEIDALEYVVVEGRIACMDDYGILRSLLVRVRPEWETADERTPHPHATPVAGSVQGEGTSGNNRIVCDKKNAPAAWLAVAADGSESSAVYMLKEQADAAAREWGWFVVPLYRSPTLTDEEREVVEIAAAYMSATGCRNTNVQATLHSLLDRTKS